MFGWNVYFLINLWILLTERLISTCIIVSDDAFGFLFAFFFLNFENLQSEVNDNPICRTEKKKKIRHRFIEQSFRLCGRRRGWDVSREQH